jgi:hypothetical protein
MFKNVCGPSRITGSLRPSNHSGRLRRTFSGSIVMPPVDIDEIIARYSDHPRYREQRRQSPNGDGPQDDSQEIDLGRADVGGVVRGEEPEAAPGVVYRDDGVGIFYPAARHNLHSEPGFGKTWLLNHAFAEALRLGGSVALLDYEGTVSTFVGRMRSLGVDDETLADLRRVGYYNLPGKVTKRMMDALVTELTGMHATIVGVDATLGALIRQGLEDNDNADQARYDEDVAQPLMATGAAFIALDHDTKDPANRTRGARGGGSKLQLADVSYALKLIKAFSRTTAGAFKLVCEKDRFGTFAIGETVAEVHVEPHDDGRELAVEVRAPKTADGPWRPTGYMEKISRALERHEETGEDPPNRSELWSMVPGNDHHKRQALAALIEDGYVVVSQDGRAVRHVLRKPYREGDE